MKCRFCRDMELGTSFLTYIAMSRVVFRTAGEKDVQVIMKSTGKLYEVSGKL
jgi:hypothetical protein